MTELVSTGSALVIPGVAAAMATAWRPNGGEPLFMPTAALNRSSFSVCLIRADADWPRPRNVMASPAATAICAIVARLRRFWRSAFRTPIRRLLGAPAPASRPLRATRRSSQPAPNPPPLSVPASVSATGRRSARRSAGSEAATASAGPASRLASTTPGATPNPAGRSMIVWAK